MKVKIVFNNEEIFANLNDSDTAKGIEKILPVQGIANTWGNEIYFDVDLTVAQSQDAVDEVEIGTLAYWSPGKKLCFFFGKTPISDSDKPKAAGPVNVLGQVTGNDAIEKLKKVTQGTKIIIEKA